jgi:hypothetical protein
LKCIHCKNDCNKKDRPDRRCPKCQHRFAFEPTAGDLVTDMMFLRAIERVSSEGRVRFLASHAYYELRRRLRKQARRSALTTAVVAFVVLVFATALIVFNATSSSPYLVLVVLFVLFASGIYKALFGPRAALPRATFDTWWSRYTDAHGEPAGLIKPAPHLRAAQPLPAELLDYSFDRAVICDHPAAADVLIANQFHFENNCAVLGVGGYPANAFATVRAMLRKNPRLLVLTIHDADPAGCQLAHRLRNDPAWFAPGTRVVDVGLRPRHARFFPGMALPAGIGVPTGSGISSAEARWLERHRMELAVVPPEQLIKRLFRVMTHAESTSDSGSGDSGSTGSGDTSSDSNAPAAAGAAVSTSHTTHISQQGHDDAGNDIGIDADASDGGADSFG